MGAILEHLMQDHGATEIEAKAALQDWDIQPITRGEQKVGELMLKENEVHFALDPEHRLKVGRLQLMRRVLDDLLKERGFLITRLFIEDKLDRLIEFMGFRYTHRDSKFRYYWMDKETRNARA